MFTNIYFAHQPTSLPYIQTYLFLIILQTHLHPTHLPHPYIPTRLTYIPTLPPQTYKTLHTCPIPVYLHYNYNHYTLLCIPALSSHTSSKSRQSDGAVAFCPCGITVSCEFYWRNYCIWIWLVYREPLAEGRGVELPQKSAILADCTTTIAKVVHNFGLITLSTAFNLVHRNSFPNFPSYFTQLCNFPGGDTFEKRVDPEKKNRNSRKSRANSRNLLEPFLRFRKEQNLYGCVMNNGQRNLFKRLYIVKGLLVLVEKSSFSKEFRWKFQCGGEGNEFMTPVAG